MTSRMRNFLMSGVITFAVFISVTFPTDNGNKTSGEVQNLTAFARLYGYIRFFHPSDEASRIDWDKFAVYGTKKVKHAKNRQELKAILEALFLPVAPTIQIYDSDEKPGPFDPTPPKNVEDLHFTAWQHFGVGLSSKSIYKSFRLGRFEIPEGTQNGIFLYFVDLKYKGKKFKLTARAKADVTGEKNGGYIYIYAGDPSGKPFVQDLMRDRPIKQNEWKTYEISGEFSQDPYYMLLGAELIGVGRMWADDFHFSLSDENGNWEEVSLSNPGFDEVEPENRPAAWRYSERGDNYEYTVVQDGGNHVLQIKSAPGYIPGMAGCNGNANFIPLPGGFRIMWTGMKVLKHDGSQHHLIGIPPAAPVKRTINAVREGRDEYLNKAIEIIGNVEK